MKLFINEIIIGERIRKGTGHITELIDDIRKNGQITPITVRIDNSGNYRLVAGYRRMMAMKALKMSQIEAYVISEDDEETLLRMEISENEIREDFTRTERMNYIKRLDEIETKKANERRLATLNNSTVEVQNSAQRGKSRDIVAEQVGISHDTIAREKKIIEHKDEIDPEDFKNWDEGKLSTNKVFKALQSRLRFLEAREEEYAELKQQAQTPQVIEKVPDDYEKLKSQVEDFKHSEKILREDKQKLAADRDKWERLYKESGRVEPTLDEAAQKDMDYLVRGIHSFLSNYGAKAWALDRRESIADYRTAELQKQAKNLLAFAQNLYELTKGETE